MKIRTYLRIFWPMYLTVTVCMLLFVQIGSRSVTVFSENQWQEASPVILIDAGHGGEDGGATSCTGVLESSINLEIACRLEDLLRLLGFQTDMIRREDVSVHTCGNTIAERKISDLKERVRRAQELDSCILVSIHQNTFPIGRYYGAQIFYNGADGAKELAEKTQELMIRTINPGSKRGAKPADRVYLMEKVDRIGILVECGFLSNPDEEAKLRSEAYQKKLCCVLASALSQYLYT